MIPFRVFRLNGDIVEFELISSGLSCAYRVLICAPQLALVSLGSISHHTVVTGAWKAFQCSSLRGFMET